MTINLKEAYFVLTIPFVFIWLLIFIFSKNTRKEQLIMSFLFLPAGSIGEMLYFRDYWHPESILSFSIRGFPIFVEDLIFMFAIAGVGGVIYETLFRKLLIRRSVSVHLQWPFIISVCIIVSISLFIIGINSIFATSMGFIAAALFIVAQRRDLFIDSLISGISIMIIMFISYIFLFNFIKNSEELLRQAWLLYDTSLGMRIFRIPITEMAWGFSVGMFLGPLYEFAKSFRLK